VAVNRSHVQADFAALSTTPDPKLRLRLLIRGNARDRGAFPPCPDVSRRVFA